MIPNAAPVSRYKLVEIQQRHAQDEARTDDERSVWSARMRAAHADRAALLDLCAFHAQAVAASSVDSGRVVDDLLPCLYGSCGHPDVEEGAACDAFVRERIAGFERQQQGAMQQRVAQAVQAERMRAVAYLGTLMLSHPHLREPYEHAAVNLRSALDSDWRPLCECEPPYHHPACAIYSLRIRGPQNA